MGEEVWVFAVFVCVHVCVLSCILLGLAVEMDAGKKNAGRIVGKKHVYVCAHACVYVCMCGGGVI